MASNKIAPVEPKAKKTKKNFVAKLRTEFKRLERPFKRPEPVQKEKLPFLLGNPSKHFTFEDSIENLGLKFWTTTGFTDLIQYNCEPIIYQSLKEVYGLPDILSGFVKDTPKLVNEKETYIVLPDEWGYLIDVGDGAVIEIRHDVLFPSIVITLWLDKSQVFEEFPVTVKEAISEFSAVLRELLLINDNEFSIDKQPKTIFSNFKVVENIYYDCINNAQELIEIAEQFSSDIDSETFNLINAGMRVAATKIHHKRNLFFVSSASFSLMALEGFVNLLYHFLLKPEFDHRDFKRITERGDSDLRILHLPAYCRGFSKTIFSPEDDMHKKVISLRDFRNNLFHCNLTPNHTYQCMMEDGFIFRYDPLSQRKFCKAEFHTVWTHFDRNYAEKVKERVSEIVHLIINEMEEDIKEWVFSWLNAPNISLVEGQDFSALKNVNKFWDDYSPT